MLKVLKAIDTQSQRQALHDQKPSSSALPDETKQNSKAKVQKVVDFLDRLVASKLILCENICVKNISYYFLPIILWVHIFIHTLCTGRIVGFD